MALRKKSGTRTRTARRWSAARTSTAGMLAVALLISACGSSDDAGSTTPASSTATSAAGSAATSGGAGAGTDSSTSGAPETAESAAVPTGGTLNVALGALPPTLNPFLTQPTPPRSFTVLPMYATLTYVDAFADGAPIVPGVAQSWEMTDETTWVFKLRPDLKFSNGEPIDAAAVKFAVDYVLDPASEAGIKAAIGPVKSVDVIDATTVQFNLDSPEFTEPRLVSILSIVPPKDFQARGADEFFKAPITGGLFKVGEFVPGESLTLVRNPDSVIGTANVDSIVFKVIVEDASRIAALRAGQVDIITKVPTDQIAGLESDGLDVLAINEARLYQADLYKSEGPLSDQRVRMALNMAVDTQGLVENIMGGNGLDEQGQLSPPIAEGFCDTVTSIPYDLDAANKLMADAGVSGLKLTFGTSQGFLTNDALLAQAIGAQLEELDAVDSVDIQVMEFSKYLDVFYGKAPAQDMFAWGMSSAPGLDITRNLSRFTTNESDRNPGGYTNPEYDKIYDEIRATPVDDPKRQDLQCQASQIVRDQALVLFGLYMPDVWGTDGKVQGFQVDANGNPKWLAVGITS